MGASGFGTLAGHFRRPHGRDLRPRGVERSEKTDLDDHRRLDQHADDRIGRPRRSVADRWTSFASSGGANALPSWPATRSRSGRSWRTRPPAAVVLPDREAALAACRDVHESYLRGGTGPGMAKFIAIVSHKGPIGADTDQPALDPAMFGLPTDDDGSRTDPLLGQNMVCTHYQFDFAALRAASTWIVIGVGAESDGELASCAAFAVAERFDDAGHVPQRPWRIPRRRIRPDRRARRVRCQAARGPHDGVPIGPGCRSGLPCRPALPTAVAIDAGARVNAMTEPTAGRDP